MSSCSSVLLWTYIDSLRVPLSFFWTYINSLLIFIRSFDHLLSPELVAGRLTGLSCWADHANLASGVSKRDLAAGVLRRFIRDVVACDVTADSGLSR